jgi:hypothetical protein
MNLDKMTPAYGTLFVFALFLICVSGNALFDTSAYAQITVDNSNATNANLAQPGNVTASNTNAIPYVLNVTNSSNTTTQAVDQVIQAISGGQSTSLQQVLDAAGNGNSSSSLEQVIDAASSVLNNQSANLSNSNMTNNSLNTSSSIP